jgi:predicted nucleotidyltransferase
MAQVNAHVMKAARKFVRDVQKEGIRVQKAYLYGSYATGRAHRGSDIDIALVSPDFSGWIDDVAKIRNALRNRDPRIESVHLPPDAFVDENPLAWEVKTKGIALLPNGRRRNRKPTRRMKTRAGRTTKPRRRTTRA